MTFCVASSDNVNGSAAVGRGESRLIVCDRPEVGTGSCAACPESCWRPRMACRSEPGPLSAVVVTDQLARHDRGQRLRRGGQWIAIAHIVSRHAVEAIGVPDLGR